MARRPPRQAPPVPTPGPDREPAKPPRWLRPSILLLAALALMGWFTTAAADSDTWWILKTGQYVVQNHALPVPDPFSFTTYMGKPPNPAQAFTRDYNLKFEWLAAAILYLVYASAGFPGMILLRAAMLSAFSATSGLIVFHRTRSLYRAFAATSLTAFLASIFVSDRPYQFTNLLLGVTLLTLEYRRGLWLLPPVFCFWANCHGGYVVGLVVLGAYIAEAFFLRWRGAPLAGERRLWLVGAACLLASGLNPNGFRGLMVLLAYRQSAIIQTLFEWQRPSLWPPTLVALLLAAAVSVLFWMRREVRVSDWLLLAAFGAAYASAVRNTLLAGLVVSWVIFSYLPSWKSRWRKEKTRALPVAAEFVTAGLIAALILAELVQGRGFQLRAAAWKYPSGAAGFLEAHHITGPMFNSYEKGGYLIWRLWPQERVFIDGRALNESVFLDYQRMLRYAGGGQAARELLDRYGIQVIVMNGFEINSGDPYVLPVALADPAEKEWKLVFEDAQAVVYLRHPPPGVLPLPSSAIFTSLEAQCDAILTHDPERPRCARSLGRLFARMGDLARARRWMEKYLNRRKDRNRADDQLYRQLTGAASP
jgi:hypothetical protein